jgi:hypothetical protein
MCHGQGGCSVWRPPIRHPHTTRSIQTRQAFSPDQETHLTPVNLRESRFGYVRDAEGLEGVAVSRSVPADEVFRCGHSPEHFDVGDSMCAVTHMLL